MPKINSVICELNPMHNGHKYIFDNAHTSNDSDEIKIAVMSGNFTQRCTPAVFDKYTRAYVAILCGADIVVELPFPWCASGVEDFAMGGVRVASGMGSDSLFFGSESADLDLLKKVAEIKESDEYKNICETIDSTNRSVGCAVNFDSVVREFGIEQSLGANDKLASEYIRFGGKMGIKSFCPIKRIADIKSATNIRNGVFDGSISEYKNDIPHHPEGSRRAGSRRED